MNREQLCHVLRSAAEVAGVVDLLVIGSQAVLGTYPEWRLPDAATRSVETDVAVDLALAGNPDGIDEEDVAMRINGAIGEGSHFHRTNGYYGEGVERVTATLTPGWRDRLVAVNCADLLTNDVAAVGWCLEANDLWLSKAAAGRPKDHEFCLALAAEGLVDLDEIQRRATHLSGAEARNAGIVLTRSRAGQS
jgi:hypothetical protein